MAVDRAAVVVRAGVLDALALAAAAAEVEDGTASVPVTAGLGEPAAGDAPGAP